MQFKKKSKKSVNCQRKLISRINPQKVRLFLNIKHPHV